ncbi:MAG: hypothetical protein IJK01_06890 [Clostridia bacterium]|nr:hypothetical protein [Clostridia bacterium]
MSNQFGFVSEETYADKMDTQNMLLAGLLEAQSGSIKPQSWAQVQALVRAGLASKVFMVGDQLTCQKNGVTLTWDIIGFDHDTPTDSHLTHSMTIQLHDVYKDLQFDAREAFYYCSAALPAGTYKITVGAHTWKSTEAGKTYQFTTTVEVPAGGQLVFKQAYDATLEGGSIDTFASATATTPLETVTMTEGSSGQSLGSIDNTIQTNLNSMQRALLGNNRWKESAIRQMLNSAAAAGSVWAAQNNYDRPPSWVTSEKGWMNDLDADFLAVVGEAEKVTAKNTVTDGGGYDTTTDKFFLLAREEVYMGKENSIDEGGAYGYYADYSDLAAAGTGEDTNRIKYLNGTKKYWWLRTPYSGGGNNVRGVYTTGAMYNYVASNSHGGAPACNII